MDELRPKQKKFIENYIENGGNATQAVYDAGYNAKNDNVAGSIGSENLTKPKIANIVKSLAERIPDDLLERVHLEGLEAYKTKDGAIIGGDVGIELVVIKEPDFATRHKYLDSAYKLKGVYAPEKLVNLNIDTEISNPEAMELAKEYEENLKKDYKTKTIAGLYLRLWDRQMRNRYKLDAIRKKLNTRLHTK